MVIVLYVLAVILAWMIGTAGFSFVNTVAYRYTNNRQLLHEHFCCDFCGTQIKAYETIPFFSYIFLKGKCRYCGEPLSKRDFINEMVGGFLGLLLFFRFGDVGNITSSFNLSSLIDIVVRFDIWKLITVLLIFLYFCILDLVILVDHDTMEIPNRFVIVMLYVAVASLVFLPGVTLVSHIIGAICISVPMYLITLLVPSAFGGGDIKLVAAIGLMIGWQLTIIGFLLGLLFGGLYGIVLLITKKKGKKEHFAFGPFLSVGYMLAVICGMDIINAYLSFVSLMRG